MPVPVIAVSRIYPLVDYGHIQQWPDLIEPNQPMTLRVVFPWERLILPEYADRLLKRCGRGVRAA